MLGSWVSSGERVLGFAVCPHVLGVLCIQHLPRGSPRALSLPTCHSTPSVCDSMVPTIHRGKLRLRPVNDHTQGPIDWRKKAQSLIPGLSLQSLGGERTNLEHHFWAVNWILLGPKFFDSTPGISVLGMNSGTRILRVPMRTVVWDFGGTVVQRGS